MTKEEIRIVRGNRIQAKVHILILFVAFGVMIYAGSIASGEVRMYAQPHHIKWLDVLFSNPEAKAWACKGVWLSCLDLALAPIVYYVRVFLYDFARGAGGEA